MLLAASSAKTSDVVGTLGPEVCWMSRRLGPMRRLWNVLAREAGRKIFIGDKKRAFWGPIGIARLLRRAASVLAREGPGEVLHMLKGMGHRAFDRIDYAPWVDEQSTLDECRRDELLREVAQFARNPTISILMPTLDSRVAWLRQAIESVMAQIYPYWELCIADDASPNEEVRSVLKEYAAREPRIRLVFRDKNGRISSATNSALAMAQGEFVSLMDHEDLLEPVALFELVQALNRDPSLDMVYSDEGKIDAGGVPYEPFFKPDWSPDYLESCMYTAHLAVYRKTLVDRIGGFRSELNGAQDYDFVLRFSELTERIGHVARVLYHRRVMSTSSAASMQRRAYVVAAGVRALKERLARTGRRGTVQPSEYDGCFKVRWAPSREPLVSIIIPTAGGDRIVRGRHINLVTRCVGQIRANTTYRNYEIVIVDNGDLRFDVREELQRRGCRFITFSEPEFNISKKLNLGANMARGEFLLLLNDDTEIIAPDWIEAMLEQALKPGVGVVGAKLLYENGTIQHVGVVLREGLPDHVRKHFPGDDAGYYFSTASVRNYLAVTGACMLTSAREYQAVGGFNEAFKINYNDVDYCLKLRERGLRTIYTPHAELYHFEAASRVFAVSQEEIDRFSARWKAMTDPDPYYNGDCLQDSPPDFSLRLRSHRLDQSAIRRERTDRNVA